MAIDLESGAQRIRWLNVDTTARRGRVGGIGRKLRVSIGHEAILVIPARRESTPSFPRRRESSFVAEQTG